MALDSTLLPPSLAPLSALSNCSEKVDGKEELATEIEYLSNEMGQMVKDRLERGYAVRKEEGNRVNEFEKFATELLQVAEQSVQEYFEAYNTILVVPTQGFRIDGPNDLRCSGIFENNISDNAPDTKANNSHGASLNSLLTTPSQESPPALSSSLAA